MLRLINRAAPEHTTHEPLQRVALPERVGRDIEGYARPFFSSDG
jgi:hypothetical protein